MLFKVLHPTGPLFLTIQTFRNSRNVFHDVFLISWRLGIVAINSFIHCHLLGGVSDVFTWWCPGELVVTGTQVCGAQHFQDAWWRHQMETFSALLAICTGNSPVPAQRPVTRSFDVFFDLRPNKRLSIQWWGWWFETLSRPLWRHGNVHDEPWAWNAYITEKRMPPKRTGKSLQNYNKMKIFNINWIGFCVRIYYSHDINNHTNHVYIYDWY